MATYILLASFTDQGIRKIKDSPKRAEAFKDMAKKCGATVKDVFWTLGAYDVVAVVDDISITALGLSSGALGNVHRETDEIGPTSDIGRPRQRLAGCTVVPISADYWLPVRYPAIRPGS
jgi:uncharacterized protein with GYD domain